ncbi:MAG: FAD-dependent thymidylate synthase [bacterium]|nr:FAD-dependent thymidylate synthase [bacterium]
MSKNLENLAKNFKPRRNFSCSHTSIEVDGVFVRIPNENENSWIPLSLNGDQNETSHFAINIEDVLQDPAIIRSARVSTDRDTVAVNEKAKGLIGYLWKDRHLTPSGSGVMLRLRQETPIMYAQPFFRLFAEHNEFSGRYSELDGAYYTPHGLKSEVREEFTKAEAEAQSLYKRLISMEVAKEMARLVHLYRFKTKFYEAISLRQLLEFITWQNVTTRHNNTEFHEIKPIIKEIIKHWTPWASEALEEYPNKIDFAWTQEIVKKYKNYPMDSYALGGKNVLNKGRVNLINYYGNDNLMLSCLDDFPNPLKGFGHGQMTFSLKVPIHVFRQWVRHRYGHWTEKGINFDEIVKDDQFFVPSRFRKQTGKVGHYQFSDVDDNENEQVLELLLKHKDSCLGRYCRLRNMEVPAELAAMNLPYTFYIPVIWTVPVESLFNFFSLRCDGHAQFEIRQYANAVWEMFHTRFPLSAKVFARHIHFGDSELIKKLA